MGHIESESESSLWWISWEMEDNSALRGFMNKFSHKIGGQGLVVWMLIQQEGRAYYYRSLDEDRDGWSNLKQRARAKLWMSERAQGNPKLNQHCTLSGFVGRGGQWLEFSRAIFALLKLDSYSVCFHCYTQPKVWLSSGYDTKIQSSSPLN